MEASADLGKLWTDNMVETLTKEQPLLQKSALRVLFFILETHKISHPDRQRLYENFEKGWTQLQNNLESMMSKMDADRGFAEEDITHAEEDFESKLLVREREAMKSSVSRVWNTSHFRGKPPDWANHEINNFMRCWGFMDGILYRMIDMHIPREKDMLSCCDLKCFLLPNECVDGVVCGKCRSYGNCYCDCSTYMKYMLDTHCCPSFCTKPELGTCVLCPGACLCKCVAHLRDALKRVGIETTRIDGREMEVVEHRGGGHCCENKCFVIPVRLIRGLACKICDAVNFCKCECVAWKNRKSRPFQFLKKTTCRGLAGRKGKRLGGF